MKPTIPTDIPKSHRYAYVRGWYDRASAGASRAASFITPARSAAARANGAKNRKPKIV